MVGYIKNSVMHNVKGISASQMSNQKFLTWLAKIASIVNDRPLILGAPLSLSLTPNDILQFKSGDFVGSWENETKVGKQLSRVKRYQAVLGGGVQQEIPTGPRRKETILS